VAEAVVAAGRSGSPSRSASTVAAGAPWLATACLHTRLHTTTTTIRLVPKRGALAYQNPRPKTHDPRPKTHEKPPTLNSRALHASLAVNYLLVHAALRALR
jgi:hypothetical protein